MKVIEAIKKIYPTIQGGFVYWKTKQDGSPLDNFIDGLAWENAKFAKPTWEQIEVQFDIVELEEAKTSKLAELETFHDSLPARVFYAKTLKNTFTLTTLEKHRALLFEQISMCDSANKSGFPMNQIGYNHKEIKPNGELVSEFISLANINWIYANLGNIVNKNYEIKLTHQTNIRKLQNIADVAKYDFKVGYLLNQTIILK
jgi:hypothetical protein